LIGERPPEVQPTAVALQRLGPLQGQVMAIDAAAVALLLLEDMELLELDGGEETEGLADGVVFQQQPPAVVVEEELQGPEGGGVAVDGAEDAAAVLDRRLEGG